MGITWSNIEPVIKKEDIQKLKKRYTKIIKKENIKNLLIKYQKDPK